MMVTLMITEIKQLMKNGGQLDFGQFFGERGQHLVELSKERVIAVDEVPRAPLTGGRAAAVGTASTSRCHDADAARRTR